jgi:hypothetical protein
MMFLSRPIGLFFLLAVVCLSACTRDDDPDGDRVYFGLQGDWEVRIHTRGGTDLRESWNGYSFYFESVEGMLYMDRYDDGDYILAEYRTLETNGLTLLEIECLTAASVCDSLAGRWQALNINGIKADFARRVASTGALERLQFRH